MAPSAKRVYRLTGRGAMYSPGAPSLGHEIERRFWQQIATGITSEKAAEAVGASQAVGSRWFRYRGGMPLFMSKPIAGRYLSFAEREDIALLSVQGLGVRDRPSYRAQSINRFARTHAQCGDPWWLSRISCFGRAVEGRTVR
jgi:hypothetical protein